MKRLLALSLAVVLALVLPMAPVSAQGTETKLTAGDDGAAGDYFGWSVSISGDTAVVGAWQDDGSKGSAYVFVRSGTTWSQQAKLTADDGAAGDQFGGSVSISGDTVVVGAQGDDDVASASGSAYVFLRTDSTWSQQAKLTASDPTSFDLFGSSVSISGDTAVVGAKLANGIASSSGSAYVFLRTDSTWSQQDKLIASDGAGSDYFGNSVSISGDTVAVGAVQDDGKKGSAYVFLRSGTTWSPQTKLTAGDGAQDDLFGNSVSISGDTVVVGAHQDDDNGTSSGSAYVFVRTGTTWSTPVKLIAGDGAIYDYFGISVSISGDTVVVGAHRNDVNSISSGSAYMFERSDTTWSQQTKLTPSDGAQDDYFGYSVSISGDTVVVGAYYDDDDGTSSGSAYVYGEQQYTDVEIDIKPGSEPNSINPDSKGVISVAILTTSDPDFDAASVNASTVTFGPGAATMVHKKAHLEDVDEDGDIDMVLHFKTQETDIAEGDTEATLTGKTTDGKNIVGTDSVVTVPPEGKGKANSSSNPGNGKGQGKGGGNPNPGNGNGQGNGDDDSNPGKGKGKGKGE